MDFIVTQHGVLHTNEVDSPLLNTYRPIYEVIRAANSVDAQ